jgi:hypothetical protein
LCKNCTRLPKSEIEKVSSLREIEGFLRQSHISDKNRKRLAVLAVSEDDEVSQKARVVDQVAAVYPYKKKRLGKLARTHRELIRQLEQAGLIFPSLDYVDEAFKDYENVMEIFPNPTADSPLDSKSFTDDEGIPF